MDSMRWVDMQAVPVLPERGRHEIVFVGRS
jgi:hypothetical protein